MQMEYNKRQQRWSWIQTETERWEGSIGSENEEMWKVTKIVCMMLALQVSDVGVTYTHRW